ncbi:MAG: glyoxylate/hydroxypyruvate reductase A [Betaproteobacteria bacterium]
MVRVSYCDPSSNPEPWLDGLRARLPGMAVENWSDGDVLADYAVTWAPPQRFIDQQTGLRALFNVGAGVDKLLRLRLPPTLRVIRLDDAGMGVQMAEYVCHAVSRHFREFAMYEAQAHQGRWAQRTPRARAEFAVGILGLGVLGQRVAVALRQFEFPVLGWSRQARRVEGVSCFAGPDGLADFLGRCQALVCLLPLTPDTRDILGRDNLARLPVGAYVVNVARGEHVVDDELLALVDSGHLAGATLDVFRSEPLPAEHAFWRHPHIHVTPHTSAQTLRAQSIAQIAGKILALERGEPVAGMVDLTRGY